MSFSTIKANLTSLETDRRDKEEILVNLTEEKKKVEAKIFSDKANGLPQDIEDENLVQTLESQISTTKADLLTINGDIAIALNSYESLDPWDSSVIGSFDDNTPILLTPVRIETRYETYVELGVPKYELWIRIFPENLHMQTHEKALSDEELEDGTDFYDLYSDTEKTREEKLNAWNNLCVSYGTERAAWIAKYFDEELTNEKFDSWSQQPETRIMPDKFIAYLYSTYDSSQSNNVPSIVSKGKPIPPTLKLGINPNDEESLTKDGNNNIEAVADDIKWLLDFNHAINKGMGLKVPLTQTQFDDGFERITVLGVKNITDQNSGKELLEDLLDSQHYTDGLSVLKQATHTKNSQLEKSGFTSYEFGSEETYKTEREGELYTPTNDESIKTDGQRIAEALGIDFSVTQNIHRADGKDIANAMYMAEALYPSTVGYYITDVMHPTFSPLVVVAAYDVREETRKFFKDYIRGRGALPSMRFGKIPYGILPVSTNSITEGGSPPNVVDQYYNDVYALIGQLDNTRNTFVTGISSAGDDSTDPQSTMTDILKRNAVSTDYYERQAVGPAYVWNQFSFGNESVNASSWKTQQENFISQFQNNTGITFNEVPKNLWMNFRDVHKHVDKPVVSDVPLSDTQTLTNHGGGNSNYLEWLTSSGIYTLRDEDFTTIGCQIGTTPPNTLLYNYLRQSLLLEYYETACDIAGISYNDRREKELVNMDQVREVPTQGPFSPPPEGNNRYQTGPSRWAVFDEVHMGMPIGQYIDMGLANHLPSAVRLNGVKDSINMLAGVTTAELDLLFREVIDVVSYRFDSWKLGTMTRRLDKMRHDNLGNRLTGVYLGSYGWLENIKKTNKTTTNETMPAGFPSSSQVLEDDKNKGYIHAPSISQAATAAILRAGYEASANSTNSDTHEINLSSERVRHAKYIIQGINNGVSLDALLGYEFERAIYDSPLSLNKYILRFRNRFKIASITEENDDTDKDIQASLVQSQNVVNGYQLIKTFKSVSDIFEEIDTTELFPLPYPQPQFNDEKAAIIKILNYVEGVLDAISDLGVSEGVFQVVNNNPDAAGSLAEALSGGTNMPQVNVTEDPKSGYSVNNKVALNIIPKLDTEIISTGNWLGVSISKMAKAEPSLNEWLKEMMPSPDKVACTVEIDSEVQPGSTVFKLKDLNLQPIDFIFLFSDELKNDESKLCQLIRYKVRSGTFKDGETPFLYDYDTPVSIDFTAKGDADFSFYEFHPLLTYLKEMVINSTVLKPSVFKAPGSSVEPNQNNFDYSDLYTRVDLAYNALGTLKTNLNSELQETVIDYTVLSNLLLSLADYNIEGSIPLSSVVTQEEYKAMLISQSHVILNALTNTDGVGILDRISDLGISQISNPTEAEKPACINTLMEISELLFGKWFKILPLIKFDTVEKNVWAAIKTNNTLNLSFNEEDDEDINELVFDEWLGSLSKVRKNISNLEFVRVLHEKFKNDANCFKFRTMQFPYDSDENDRWMALPVTNESELKDGRASILFNDLSDYNPNNYTCGLLIDEWVEVIPSKTQDTGIAFHYDQPNSKAPQCMLLALPSEFTGVWSWNDLVETVNQTFDEAKKRAIDYEALSSSELCHTIPMTYFPTSEGQITIGR